MSEVSIVIPIYNAEKTLHKCIKSVLNQSYKDIEIVLVNDGSKDNSLKICRKYGEEDKRIVVIDKKNEGSIKTRRKGVEIAKSRYIMFVDADDWIHEDTLKILYNETIGSQSDITVCNAYRVLSERAILRRKNVSVYFQEDKTYEGDEIRTELVEAYLYGHPFPAFLVAKLYKKSILLESGKYLNRIHFLGEDLYYNIEIFLKVSRIRVIKKPLYYYRTGGLTSRYMPYMFDDAVNGYEIQKQVIEEYYSDMADKEFDGISIMLLNTFKTCLYNCFNSCLNNFTIRQIISKYTENDSINEAIQNKGANKYFDQQYLCAIKNKNIDYLYNLGKNIYRKKRPRQLVLNIIMKFGVI